MQPLTLTSAWPWGLMKIDEWPAVVMAVLQPTAGPAKHARISASDISFASSMLCNPSGGEKDQPKTSAPPKASAELRQAWVHQDFLSRFSAPRTLCQEFDGFNLTFIEWPECRHESSG